MTLSQRWKRFALPEKDVSYSSAPWGWTVCICLAELALSLVVGLILELLQIRSGSWIGAVAVLSTASCFAMLAEQRQAGVMSKVIRRQLAWRISSLMTIIGALFVLLIAHGEALNDIPPLGWLGILVFAFGLTWGAHMLGFAQGVRLSHTVSAKKSAG